LANARRIRLALALVTLLAACGGAEAATAAPRVPEEPLYLDLRTSEGEPLNLGQLRGQPVLLFLFATYDGVSQASLRPLARFVRQHPDVQVVGVAVQPDASLLAAAWAQALSPPFTVCYEPEDRITQGATNLGPFEAVPTYVLLDAQGRERARHVGFGSQRKLESMLEAVAARQD